MNARKKLLLILSTQIATILMVVLHARVWKDFLKMLSLAMVRQALKKICFTHSDNSEDTLLKMSTGTRTKISRLVAAVKFWNNIN